MSDSKKTKNQPNTEESIFTYGITIHDNMLPFLFEDSIDSVIQSYKEMQEKNVPLDIMISIDATSEEDYKKGLKAKSIDELSCLYNQELETKIEDKIINFKILLKEEGYEEYEEYEELNEEYEELNEEEKEKIKEKLDKLEELRKKEEKIRSLYRSYNNEKKTLTEEKNKKLHEFRESNSDKNQEKEFIDNLEEEYGEKLSELEKKYKQEMINISFEEFRKNRTGKREYIQKLKQQITDDGLNINLDVIESAEKYGKVSASRNRIIDVCKTKYLVFLDGDDRIRPKALQSYVNECKNNELGNPEGRKNFKNKEEILKGEADVIYLEGNPQKEVWGNIYNVQKLRDKGIRFTKQIGSEDGYIKATLLQNNLNVVYAAEENLGIIQNYKASYSTTLEKGKEFESIIQLTNHLARHNKNGMQIWNENFKSKITSADPNIFLAILPWLIIK